MKPNMDVLLKDLEEHHISLGKAHLELLDPAYFDIFSLGEIRDHIKILASLEPENPVEIIVKKKNSLASITVLAFDYPHEFSLITGILAGVGYEIHSGDIFTYRRQKGAHSLRRRIVDHFEGRIDSTLSFDNWLSELWGHLDYVLGLLEKGGQEALKDARHHVNELVVKRLDLLSRQMPPDLYPVEIRVDNHSTPYTRLEVVAEDTPAFLYSLTNALSMQGVSIERVRIRTVGNRVEDDIDLLDAKGRKIKDPELLDRIKFCALLTKQFTHFLSKAPDPYNALSRFDYILDDIVRSPFKSEWAAILANPLTLESLAKLLGASDFLWEDFIRLNYETLIPMLRPHIRPKRLSTPPERLRLKLYEALKGAQSFDEQAQRLNEFKDREIFLIDLDHILNPDMGFESLSRSLTALAEAVVTAATEIVYASLVERHGFPVTVGGLQARFALMGLGKLGGAALGYASDIELLFIYSDAGNTAGPEPITNSEFFDKLVKGIKNIIKAKREGIFHVDLRLRPYGDSGPLACSLENFCRYYGPGGKAHSYERLSLVRMRGIAGDRAFTHQVERLRDEMIYFSKGAINPQEILKLRERQYREKVPGPRPNAKFSPGGLVDLEYGVQILQVLHGHKTPALRTPLLHEALHALADLEVLSPKETNRLLKAYWFLRDLINCMRMLRGSAKDLFFPAPDSDELNHLARRMGYREGGGFSPSQQLLMDFEAHTAAVRAFFEQHFGREAVPGPGHGTVADLILSDAPSSEMLHSVLKSAGFQDPERAYANLKRLAGKGTRQETFAKLAVVALDVLSRTPDPDMALNNWERFINSLVSPEFHYGLLLSQPMRLEIMLNIFSSSQFLSDTLVRHPGYLDWVTTPELLHEIRDHQALRDELTKALESSGDFHEWLNRMRRLRRREILRVGIRDMYLKIPVRIIMEELSMLAETILETALKAVMAKVGQDGATDLCVFALGKLGGHELNYSSDIDLIIVYEPSSGKDQELQRLWARRTAENLRADLSSHTQEGYCYRVDLRLRPFGQAGELVQRTSWLVDYYAKHASLWEVQAALKMRPIAGSQGLGDEIMGKMKEVLVQKREPRQIFEGIKQMREKSQKAISESLTRTFDVKTGLGGIRDVEFLVQGLQLAHLYQYPELLEQNTLLALDKLASTGILEKQDAIALSEDYIFLRRIEHFLQIMEDRQIHYLPPTSEEMEALSKRLLGVEGTKEQLSEKIQASTHRIRTLFSRYIR